MTMTAPAAAGALKLSESVDSCGSRREEGGKGGIIAGTGSHAWQDCKAVTNQPTAAIGCREEGRHLNQSITARHIETGQVSHAVSSRSQGVTRNQSITAHHVKTGQ
eukprot:scaffold157934_cov25-Tisochrysis_lutea.AAC.1